MKIDLIIPVFKKKGLRESLMSINKTDLVSVVLVDDGQHNDYTDILDEFKDYFEIKIIQLEKNVGQGLARQAGVDASSNEIIMFLDCGDLIYTPEIFDVILGCFETERLAQLNMKYKEKINKNEFDIGRLAVNGQAYRRKFLEEYSIVFCPTDVGSRKYEDVGHIAQCGFAFSIDSKWIGQETDLFSVIKIRDKNSISQSNNSEYDFLDRIEGVYENVAYALDKFSVRLKEKSDIYYKNVIFGYFISLCIILEIINDHNPKDTKEAYSYVRKWYYKYIYKEAKPDVRYLHYLFEDRFKLDPFDKIDKEVLFNHVMNIYNILERENQAH